VEVVFESEMSSEESRMLGSVETVGRSARISVQLARFCVARFCVAMAAGAMLSLAAVGCAPAGLGDPCTPEAIPGGGFSPREVYVESGSVQCRTRTCMVFHLDGNPECTPNCSECGGPDTCARCGEAADCVQTGADTAAFANSDERVFCSCRCSAGGNPSLPLCQCTEGYRCVPDGDPGGGYCVPDAVAISSTPAICENNEECLSGACDPATRHCL
jgi:hypothetical protein